MRITLLSLALVLGACNGAPTPEPVEPATEAPIEVATEAEPTSDAPAEPAEVPDPAQPAISGAQPTAALKATLAAELGQPVALKGKTEVVGGWALFTGAPPTAEDGSPLDWSSTPYAYEEGLDNATVALMAEKDGAWTVVSSALLCNDVCWANMPFESDAPAGLFPVGTGDTPEAALLDWLAFDFGQKVAVEGSAKVEGSWAFFSGRIPTKADGSEIDWPKTRHGQEPHGADNATFALLRKTGAQWKVMDVNLLCNDVCWEPYPTRYPDAPAALFR